MEEEVPFELQLNGFDSRLFQKLPVTSTIILSLETLKK
jgi:hypothetical protein